MYQSKNKEKKMKDLNINERLREILDVPNKNALYRDLGLNYTYLNLKNFINGKEELKQKSIDYLSKKLNVVPITLFIGAEEDFLTDEEKDVLMKIQEKFLNRVSEYTKIFENDFRRPKKTQLTEEEQQSTAKIFKDIMVDLDIEDINNIHF